jgi:hypothetical protein
MNLLRRVLVVPIISLVLMVGCAHAPIHPGAINQVDSQLYDSLLTLQASIEAAQSQLAVLPSLRGPLNNQIIPGYNMAWHAYADYHSSLVIGTPPDPTTQQKILAQVAAIAQGLQSAINVAKGAK